VPPPNPAPGTPEDWLFRARGKLVLARQPVPPGALWEDLCYWGQQTAELAIKAESGQTFGVCDSGSLSRPDEFCEPSTSRGGGTDCPGRPVVG